MLQRCYFQSLYEVSTSLSQCHTRIKYDFPPLNGSHFVFRCIEHLPSGPSWCKPVGNPCTCERPFIRRVLLAATKLCPTRTCRWIAWKIQAAFRLLSCWYPKRFCFPVIRKKCRCWRFFCRRITVAKKCVAKKMCSFFGYMFT